MEPFAEAQNDLFVRLSTRHNLRSAGIEVQVMRPRANLEATAIQEKINQALLGLTAEGPRAGLAVLVPLPGFENKQPNFPGLFGDMIFSVVVMENILINMGDKGTGITCEEAATMVMLAGASFQMMDGRALSCDGMTPLSVDQQEFNADVAYEVRFRCKAGFNSESECAMPAITVDDDNLTITCATADAVIWMTLDGSMPAPGNPTAVVVNAVFERPSGPCIIRACAYHESINPSSPQWLKLSA